MTPLPDHIRALREALAAGPTPGPWIQGGLSTRDPHWMRDVRTTDGENVALIGGGEPYKAHAVAAYIAAANPEALRAVLDALEAAQNALLYIAEQCERHPLYLGDDADEALIVEVGGDAATMTELAHQARAALTTTGA